MRYLFALTAAALGLATVAAHAGAINVNLGTAASFGVLAGSTVTNTGSSIIQGNLGVWPGAAVTGFPPGIVVNGTSHNADSVAQQAQSDLTAAYTFAANETGAAVLTGNLGGRTLTSGVYSFASAAQLTGALTLNAQGNANAVFVFQIGDTLTTASSSLVSLINGAQGGAVFWQVGSSATLGTNSSFAGNILALTSVSLQTGANITCGRALARNGGVSLDSNTVTGNGAGCGGATTVAEPKSVALLGGGALFLGLLGHRRRAA